MDELKFLATLEQVIDQRAGDAAETSYTARLLAAGERRIAQKVGEEGVEVALASVGGTDEELIDESADLLYHLLVLLKAKGLTLGDVCQRLEERHQDAAPRG